MNIGKPASLGVDGFARHWRDCDNAQLPGDRVTWRIGAAAVGLIKPDLARALSGQPGFSVGPDAVALDPGQVAGLAGTVRRLADDGWFRWRGEAFDVRADTDGVTGPVLATLDRGALPSFGVVSRGVHLNGLVRRPDGMHLWVATRAADRALDPNKLDHVVAGGIAAGDTVAGTLVKEAAEEANMPAYLSQAATPVGRIGYAMERPEGLRRDELHCFDLELPGEFAPEPHDGEIFGFELWPMRRVYETVRDTDRFKFNVNLVLIDLFARLGMPV